MQPICTQIIQAYVVNSSMGIKVHRLGYFVHVKPMELSKRIGLLIHDGVTISVIGLNHTLITTF